MRAACRPAHAHAQRLHQAHRNGKRGTANLALPEALHLEADRMLPLSTT